MSNATEQMRQQWQNPAETLSLLMLVGGDVVQMAIAQLSGSRVRPFGKRGPRINVVPVAFSFGYVAFSWAMLLSAVGSKRLMPAVERPAIVINCANASDRENQSWVLERLLRDYEASHQIEDTECSMRIGIFELVPFIDGEKPRSTLDLVWISGCATMVAQIIIAAVPWIVYGDWNIMAILLSGTILALFTGALPQWQQEKWAGNKLGKESVHALTRGNGHRHIMILVGQINSISIEAMATAIPQGSHQTTIVAAVLVVLWGCLLICTAGVKENTWFLVAIGAMGMVQNLYAAGSIREPDATGMKMRPFQPKPHISSSRRADVHLQDMADTASLDALMQHEEGCAMPPWDGPGAAVPRWLAPLEWPDVARTQGALQELEKWVPGAGLALLTVFFRGQSEYQEGNIRDRHDKLYWKRASDTRRQRRDANRRQRRAVRGAQQQEV